MAVNHVEPLPSLSIPYLGLEFLAVDLPQLNSKFLNPAKLLGLGLVQNDALTEMRGPGAQSLMILGIVWVALDQLSFWYLKALGLGPAPRVTSHRDWGLCQIHLLTLDTSSSDYCTAFSL